LAVALVTAGSIGGDDAVGDVAHAVGVVGATDEDDPPDDSPTPAADEAPVAPAAAAGVGRLARGEADDRLVQADAVSAVTMTAATSSLRIGMRRGSPL
jgi:hypothetical protein